MNADFQRALEQIVAGRDLTREASHAAFSAIMSGAVPEAAIGGLLRGMATKGETVDELVGAAEAMRERVVPVACRADCIDTCGTGGDGISTFNVSTTAAIVAAAAGATVAKHGNRSTTRVCGSTEVLEHLGIDTEAPIDVVERSLDQIGIGYLNARNLHPAMKYAAPVRQALPIRTMFNLLGPLTNPAGARRQLLGVPQSELVDKIAQALAALDAVHAWVVHGTDGLCDVTITAATMVAEVRGRSVRTFEVTPEDVGLHHAPLEALRVNTPTESTAQVLAVLRGQLGGPRDHALMNTGAALVVAGLASNLKEGVDLAAATVDSGDAMRRLEAWRAIAGKPGKGGKAS